MASREVVQQHRPADFALANHDRIRVAGRLLGASGHVQAAQHGADRKLAISVRELVGVLDLGRVGGDGGHVARWQLVQRSQVGDLVVADLIAIRGHAGQGQQREARE